MCVYADRGPCIHQTETVGQYWGMENQHAILKERLMLKHHSAGLQRFLRPTSPFLICCISRKDGVQIKFPSASEVSLHTKQGCA